MDAKRWMMLGLLGLLLIGLGACEPPAAPCPQVTEASPPEMICAASVCTLHLTRGSDKTERMQACMNRRSALPPCRCPVVERDAGVLP